MLPLILIWDLFLWCEKGYILHWIKLGLTHSMCMCVLVEVEPWALHMLGKHFYELHSSPLKSIFLDTISLSCPADWTWDPPASVFWVPGITVCTLSSFILSSFLKNWYKRMFYRCKIVFYFLCYTMWCYTIIWSLNFYLASLLEFSNMSALKTKLTIM